MFTHHDGFAAERGAGHDIRRQRLPYRPHGRIHRAMPGQVNHQTGLIGLCEIRQGRATRMTREAADEVQRRLTRSKRHLR
jgi:hypothetical protein